MSNYPKISIVTPSFNQADYVEATVRSVFNQRYQNLEYIFMDGGSTDETLANIEKYKNKFAHFESGPDGGQSAAIAKGFDLATGQIMAYLNSDDVLLPGTLNFVADYFARNPNVDFIYSHRCFIDEKNNVKTHWILPPHSSFMMKRCDLIPQETCFWRRSLFEKAGNIDSTFRFAMDYDLFVRYMHSGKFKRVNKFLAAFRVHGESKTSTQLSTIGQEEVSRVYKKYNIKPVPYLGDFFSLWVQLKSSYFIRKKDFYTGLQPGYNFNLNETWGGILVESQKMDETL